MHAFDSILIPIATSLQSDHRRRHQFSGKPSWMSHTRHTGAFAGNDGIHQGWTTNTLWWYGSMGRMRCWWTCKFLSNSINTQRITIFRFSETLAVFHRTHTRRSARPNKLWFLRDHSRRWRFCHCAVATCAHIGDVRARWFGFCQCEMLDGRMERSKVLERSTNGNSKELHQSESVNETCHRWWQSHECHYVWTGFDESECFYAQVAANLSIFNRSAARRCT